MKPFRISCMIFLAILLLLPMQSSFAQNEHKEMKAEEPVDSMYSVKEADPLSGSDDSPLFSPTDLFTADELASPDPMPEMKMDHGEHAGHQEPQIELATHTRVSSSSKGFGTAIGITLFVGIAFAGLTIMRPGE